jgi:transposase
MDVAPATVEAALARIKPQIEAQDFELFARLWGTLTLVMRLVRVQRASIARLRRLFGMASSERTRDVLGPQPTAAQDETTAPPLAAQDETTPLAAQAAGANDARVPDEPQRPKRPGHGRLAASDYPTAVHHAVVHTELSTGCVCPRCRRGTLYQLADPARIVRIIGQPMLSAVCWDCQRLRCSGCGDVFTARAPQQAQGPKFDETAVAMIALCRFGAGLPHHRLERLQRNLQTPIASSTQWEALDQSAPELRPVFEHMERIAAQANVIHDDDTYVRILAFMGESRAKLLKNGDFPNPDRTGLYTTAILSIGECGPIALFYSGRKHAGENLSKLLTARDPEREPPTLMSDALSRNVPKGQSVIEANCLAHGRRNFIDQFPNFPTECRAVLELLRQVFAVEADCKLRKLSAQQRLYEHQTHSLPVMNSLHTMMTEDLACKRVEPNSGLGKAYDYMLKRWDKFTLFLRQTGAPIDNNLCERALKMAICHRRNSLFYRTQHGASVGDIFTSLIHTAELHAQNPFDYLCAILRNPRAAAASPGAWLPWTYQTTLAALSVQSS